MPDSTKLRRAMVKAQVEARGITDPHLLAAMREVPREAFVGEALAEFAYEDCPLPIDEGQAISQPYIVALMIEAAKVGPYDRVLEVGAGSGYAAAVLSRVADHVHAIERQAGLAVRAAERFARLGYGNIELRTGDGSAGWPEAAPFDAILVSAGGPHVPGPLKRQLAIGGRLVMPVGDVDGEGGGQRLVRVTRREDGRYDEEDLGDVRFVPLIGAYGWAADPHSDALVARSAPASLPQRIRAAAAPLPPIEDPAFAAAFDRYADARVVLLGEASHGTSEFYRARAAITRRLIERHGFSIVAVEADWPDAAAIDRHVRHKPPADDPEPVFQRFPTWMWRNTDVEAFTGWLREHNRALPPEARAGFYGLDLYNLGASLRAVIDYLDRADPEAAQVARARYGCLLPFGSDPATYGRMALSRGYAQCEAGVVAMLRELLERTLADGRDEALIDATQNARLVADAEAYYRVMYYGGAESWNLRDRHMFETLDLLLKARGEGAKAVVWAHNSHIGDARATAMGRVRDELNLGQLCREAYGDAARLIGFGTHAGTVAAATDWDGPMEVKRVNPSRPGSYEHQCHEAGLPRFLLDLGARLPADTRAVLAEERLERFIGVIYRPETERWSHYAEAVLPEQFDGWVWFDETQAVIPLGGATQRPGAEETFPTGL